MSDLTPKEIFEEKIAKNIADDPETAKAIDAVYQFNIEGPDGGTWTVDLQECEVYEGEADDAQCTIFCTDEDFVAMQDGSLPAMQAFMQGKLRIEGDMALAMKLQQVLGV